jgi:hypothetical protein
MPLIVSMPSARADRVFRGAGMEIAPPADKTTQRYRKPEWVSDGISLSVYVHGSQSQSYFEGPIIMRVQARSRDVTLTNQDDVSESTEEGIVLICPEYIVVTWWDEEYTGEINLKALYYIGQCRERLIDMIYNHSVLLHPPPRHQPISRLTHEPISLFPPCPLNRRLFGAGWTRSLHRHRVGSRREGWSRADRTPRRRAKVGDEGRIVFLSPRTLGGPVRSWGSGGGRAMGCSDDDRVALGVGESNARRASIASRP